MRFAVLALATSSLALAAPAGLAHAQSNYGSPGYGSSSYGSPGYGSQPRYPSSGERPERPEAPERAEAAEGPDPAQDLVRQLNLRGDQQAAYRDYQAAFQAQGQDRGQDQGDGQDDIARLAGMTTPQRLDDTARQMDRDRADFERVAAATRRFYATLDPGQRRTFDRLTAPQAEPDDGPGADGRDDDRAPSQPPPPQR